MFKGYRLGTVVGVAAVLGMAAVAYAQAQAPAQIAARQEAMKGNGGAAQAMTKMIRGETPWNQQDAVKALTTINTTAKGIPALFKDKVDAPAGVKNDAKPEIWSNK